MNNIWRYGWSGYDKVSALSEHQIKCENKLIKQNRICFVAEQNQIIEEEVDRLQKNDTIKAYVLNHIYFTFMILFEF